MQLLSFLVNLVFGAAVTLLLVRLLLQKHQASWYNPLTRFCLSVTNPVVKPLRRVIPGVGGFDLSIVVLAWIVACVQACLLIALQYRAVPQVIGVVAFAFLTLLVKLVYIYMGAIIILAISSWFSASRHQPLIEIVDLLTYPLLSRIQKRLPVVSGIDFSSMLALLVLYVVSRFVLQPLEVYTLRLALFGV